jgi:hypothetical protein
MNAGICASTSSYFLVALWLIKQEQFAVLLNCVSSKFGGGGGQEQLHSRFESYRLGFEWRNCFRSECLSVMTAVGGTEVPSIVGRSGIAILKVTN